jgi:hypothetical protein
MPRERYIPADNQWINYPKADWDAFLKDVEGQVGQSVPMSILPSGEIVLDTANLPNGVSENDAKQAIRDNHPHR